MRYVPEVFVDRLIADDLGLMDLTTTLLGIGSERGRIRICARENGVCSGLAVAGAILGRVGCAPRFLSEDGARIVPGEAVLEAEGEAGALHIAWKLVACVLEYCSGVATRTRRLVDAAAEGRPGCAVTSTRKHAPGVKELSIRAVLDGGGYPHRLGMSETVLVFPQHRAFVEGGWRGLSPRLAAARRGCPEKKVFVEVESLEEARAAVEAGAEGLQFDKAPPGELAAWVRDLKAGGFAGALLAAGGIRPENGAEYARTGVDALATSWMYHGSPLDFGARMARLGGPDEAGS